VVAGAGAVWVGVPDLSVLVRIDPATNKIVSRDRVFGQPCGFLAADANSVWVAGAHCGNYILRLDPRSNKNAGQVSGNLMAPIGLALGFNSLWAADLDAKTIDRIDTHTGKITGSLRVGGQPIRLATGYGSVWVRDDGGRVLRIQP
jgi:streptogramin lyase